MAITIMNVAGMGVEAHPPQKNTKNKKVQKGNHINTVRRVIKYLRNDLVSIMSNAIVKTQILILWIVLEVMGEENTERRNLQNIAITILKEIQVIPQTTTHHQNIDITIRSTVEHLLKKMQGISYAKVVY